MLGCAVFGAAIWIASQIQLTAAARSQVSLVNNRYTSLLVAIGEEVPENPLLIERLQTVFRSSSAYLFNATRRRAQFSEVTILLPQSWSKKAAYSPSKQETFDKANVLVDVPNQEYGNTPYTRQVAGCGQEGDYIHLTPELLINIDASEEMYGDLGKIIVHEWGHLRWGLFDEYPLTDDISEHFYQTSNEEIQATRCSTRIAGIRRNRITNDVCKNDPDMSLPEKDCRFYPARASTFSSGSYMYYHYLSSVVSFCDSNSSDPYSHHNAEAPNQHNKLCNQMSAWEIMRQHKDFAAGANPPIPSTQTLNTTIKFNIVQRKSFAVALVMDTSGSMTTDNNHIKLDVAVKNYLRNTIPNEALVGLVYFADTATKLTQQMRFINSSADRESLASLMRPSAGGFTSIGAGMTAALELLRAGGRDATGNFMVIVSDGAENQRPFIRDVLPTVKDAGVIIDTLLFTVNADPQLISMSAETGGLSYFYSGREDSTALTDGLMSTVQSRLPTDSRANAIPVASRSITLTSSNSTCLTVFIEKDLGKDTKFIFSWSSTSYIFVISLISPNGSAIYSNITVGMENSKILFFTGNIEAGSWIVCIKNTGRLSAVMLMQVESKPRDGLVSVPITVTVKSTEEVKDFSGTTRPVAVYAYVLKGSLPVLNALVVATMEGPSNSRVDLRLRDSGSGSDVAKDDGVYSGYFFRAPMTGTYSVKVRVEGNQNTSVKSTIFGSRAAAIQEPGRNYRIPSVVLKPTDTFERVASGDLVAVRSIPDPRQGDKIPPARIQDLRVTAAKYDEGRIHIEFTAVGDDYDEGRAHHYLLRRSSDYNRIYSNFSNATEVTDDDVVIGNLSSPAVASTVEKFVIRADKGSLVALAIVAVDAANNQSPPSNIVMARLTYVPPLEPASDNDALIIGLSVAAAVLAMVVAAVAFLFYKRRKNQK